MGLGRARLGSAPPRSSEDESSGLRTHARPFESGRGVHSLHSLHPRVAQLRRAPLLQRGGWGFESLTADMPLKLSSAERPPCKRTVVGSIPTWGSDAHPLVAQHGRGARFRPGRFVVRIHAGGLDATSSNGRTPGCYPGNAGSTPAVAAFIPRSSNGRIFGSEPKDAWFESRPRSSTRTRRGVHSVSKTEARGFDSFRPCSRPGRLAGKDAGLSHR